MKTLRGFRDILPPESDVFHFIEEKSREIFNIFSYREIRSPTLEETALFIKSTGETTDIVEKEMYSFTDNGGRNVTLRPEGTPQIVRAFINHNMSTNYVPPFKFFYIGNMFRAERPQAGRFREFEQIGVEYIGNATPFSDAEVIILLYRLLSSLNIKDVLIEVNSLGCDKCRQEYKNALTRYLEAKIDSLCPACQRRYQRNPLRILDCKIDREKIRDAPEIDLCSTCNLHFEKLSNLLKKSHINFQVNKFLVRGLDYYTGTVFEAKSSELGAQDEVAAGGRYDNLIKSMGGPNMPAVGWALGTDRVAILLKDKVKINSEKRFFVACAGENARDKCFEVLLNLRKNGIVADFSNFEASLRSQMRTANKSKSSFAIIIGEKEIAQGMCILKNLKKGEEKQIPLVNIIEEALSVMEKKSHDEDTSLRRSE